MQVLTARSRIHLSKMIDDTLACVFTHAAAAQWMHGYQVLAEKIRVNGTLRPQGIRNIGATQRFRDLVQLVTDLVEDRCVTNVRPSDLQSVMFVQRHRAIRTVVGHDQKRLRIADGTAIWSKK